MSAKVVQLQDRSQGDAAAHGREVIATEIAGLAALSQSLGSEFNRAIDLLSAIKGRVIISGMGKSGHIANKMAATFASTGTPAHFVHPAEASHGDLGMITRDDAVIALSNSGETTELSDLIAHCKRFQIPLIAMTSGAGSALDDAATVSLLIPKSEEACPMGLAPTTSTTMALALGDALAVVLLEAKGFSQDQFRDLHPGGKLGQRLLKVSQLMHKDSELPLAKPDTTMKDVILEMSAKRFGCVGIVDGAGKLLGIITDGDLRRKLNADFLNQRAENVMTANPTTINAKTLAVEALGIMNTKSITCLFVLDGKKPAGIVHIHDILRAGVR